MRDRETHLGPPSRLVGGIPSGLERPEPESPALLLPSFVGLFLDTLYPSVVSDLRVLVIAIDAEIGSIRPNIAANLIMCEFWCPK